MANRVEPLPAGHAMLEHRVLRVLGQGGFGTTYLCRDEHLQRLCVVKEFTPHHLVIRKSNGSLKASKWSLRNAFVAGRTRFLNEARKLAQFSHPNIVRVNRYFESNETGYFVMDYEASGSLRSLLRGKPHEFTEGEIEAIILPLCKGLAELHKAALIHRDIKPDNIIIRPNGSPALIDFGAAVDYRHVSESAFEIMATPTYAAIEQFDPKIPQGPWTDIYALGAVMYEMIAGQPPVASLKRLSGVELQDASELGRGKYGDRLLGLVDKCLAMNFVERPKGTGEFVVLLEANKDHLLRKAIAGVSVKMLGHFMNFAKPNEGLYCDELIAFVVCFPIIDLSWRIGKGTPDKATFARLYGLLGYDEVRPSWDAMLKRGFQTVRSEPSLAFVRSRLDEYAATYLLDRQEPVWRFEMTSRKLAKNCIAASHVSDVDGFISLMEDVIDRARGRIKKEFNKAFEKVTWRLTDQGWMQEIVSFDE